jgi:hypothetical protein
MCSISIQIPGGKEQSIVVNDSRLNGMDGFVGGHLSIPSVNGRTVKGHYIKDLVTAMRWMGVI